MGGIGKTQLALEYVYRQALCYSAIFWIEAEKEEQILASLLRIAELLDLRERAEAEQQRIVAAVLRWLSTHAGWLLIWDNIEDFEMLARYLPASRKGAMLLTTRRIVERMRVPSPATLAFLPAGRIGDRHADQKMLLFGQTRFMRTRE